MSAGLLRDLMGLSIVVVNPYDSDGTFLVDHLRRIGCSVRHIWPTPPMLPTTDVVFLSIDGEDIPLTKELLRSLKQPQPTLIGIASYENPATLQVILESGALAVLQRPVKPLGILTSLAIARSQWLKLQTLTKEMQRYKRRVLGDQQVMRAKAVLMGTQGLTEPQAYDELRRTAMERRLSIHEVAALIVDSET